MAAGQDLRPKDRHHRTDHFLRVANSAPLMGRWRCGRRRRAGLGTFLGQFVVAPHRKVACSIHVERRRIAIVVSPWYPVPPKGYGGIELMAYNLARELSNRGHQVTVIGRQGSRGPFQALALAPVSWTKQMGTPDEVPRHHLFLHRTYEALRRRAFDVVHDNSGLTGILVATQARLQAPVVATIHGPLTEAEGDFLRAVSRQIHLVAI